MRFQNRVDPEGQLRFAPDKGALMGNRGILHDAGTQEILVQWRHKSWVACDPTFKGIKRTLFGPSTYSELFFLDEATAFSAGHRPCNYCRRARFSEFKTAWLSANQGRVSGNVSSAADIDKVLHAERAIRGGAKVTYTAALAELPVGAFFEHDGETIAVGPAGLLRWSFGGYAPFNAVTMNNAVQVLTPKSIVNMFSAGFRPAFDPTARV